MVMTYSHAKVKVQWSVISEDRVETNGQMDRWREVSALPPMLMHSVNIEVPIGVGDSCGCVAEGAMYQMSPNSFGVVDNVASCCHYCNNLFSLRCYIL